MTRPHKKGFTPVLIGIGLLLALVAGVIAIVALEARLAPPMLALAGLISPKAPENAVLSGSAMGSLCFNLLASGISLLLTLVLIAVASQLLERVTIKPIPDDVKQRRRSARKKRWAPLYRVLLAMGAAVVVLAMVNATSQFYVSGDGVTFQPFVFSHGAHESWGDVQSVELGCNSVWRGKNVPTLYLPGYIVHFRDGQSADLWFGPFVQKTITGAIDERYNFTSRYPQISAHLAKAAMTTDSDLARCAGSMRDVNDAAIRAAVAFVCPENSRCSP